MSKYLFNNIYFSSYRDRRNIFNYYIYFFFILFVYELYPYFHGPKLKRLRESLFLILSVRTSIPIFLLAFFGKYVNSFEAKSHLIFLYIGSICMLLKVYSLL